MGRAEVNDVSGETLKGARQAPYGSRIGRAIAARPREFTFPER